MTTGFWNLLEAELLLLRKRTATWAILGIWLAVAAVFVHILPYASFLSGSTTFAETLDSMLPANLAQSIGEGLPFYGGALALILGVLVIGSEFGWNTWKTLLTQTPGRLPIFGAKLAALGIAMVVFVVAVYLVGAVASTTIATIEGAAIAWPSAAVMLESLLGGWLILSVWASAGVLLAMLTRGTSLAIGIGILWGLALEGMLSALAGSISWLEWLIDILLRANGYSLMRAVNGATDATPDGPGAFAGPYVSGPQAIAVLVVYLVTFLGVSAWLLHRRDIA